MKTFLILGTSAAFCFLSFSCSTPSNAPNKAQPEPKSAATSRPHVLPAPVRADCLSIQEGDRHVEFNGSDLYLAESGKPRQLTLNDGDTVICEKLEIVRNAKQPAVFIKYRTYEAGTSVGVSDLKIAIASIKDAKWILQPLIVERRFRRGDGVQVDERATYQWTDDKNHPSLVVTDTSEKTSKTIIP